MQALADAAVARFGAVHLVCNNAGIAVFGHLVDATPADWEYTMRVNFWGVVHGVQAFAPRLVAQGQGGHIVNTASMAGLVGMEWLGVYCASKFAVVGLTESLHRELKPHGIGVSVLCPDDRADRHQPELGAQSSRRRCAIPAIHSIFPMPAPRSPGPCRAASSASRRSHGVSSARSSDSDLYVLTHPEQRAFLRRRAARLDRMFEPDRW